MIFPKSVISIYHPLNRFLGHFDTGKSDLIEQLPVQPNFKRRLGRVGRWNWLDKHLTSSIQKLFSDYFFLKAKSKSAGFGVQYWPASVPYSLEGASLIPAERARSVDECQQVTGQDLD